MLVVGISIVSIFSLGVVGINQWALRARGGNGVLGLALAVVCIAITIGCTGAALFLVVDKRWTP